MTHSRGGRRYVRQGDRQEPLWSEPEIEMAKNLWLAGNTGQYVADVLNLNFKHTTRTRLAVIGKLNRLGLKRANPEQSRHAQKRLNAAVKAKKEEAAHAAADYVPLAQAFNRTPTTVTFMSREFGQCAWPVELNADVPLCCGAPVTGRGSYCASHARLGIRKAA